MVYPSDADITSSYWTYRLPDVGYVHLPGEGYPLIKDVDGSKAVLEGTP